MLPNKNLLDDEKKYRKLRKVLRQIENLNLLPRCLNEEEKAKVNFHINFCLAVFFYFF